MIDSTNKPSTSSEYVLTKDITGKERPKREPFNLKDKNGNEVRLPHHPNKNCNKCYGRGHVGIDLMTAKFVICKKCYPIL